MTRRQFWFGALIFVAFLVTDAAGYAAQARAAKNVVTILTLSDLDQNTALEQVSELLGAVRAVKGVKRARVVRKKGQLILLHRPTVSLDAIERAVGEAGFSIEDTGRRPDNEDY